MFRPNSIPPEERYKNIGGWLLLFCICLIVFPIINLIQTSQFFRELGFYYYEYPTYFRTAFIDYIIFVGLMILAIIAGIAIIRKRVHGVKTAKLFLFLFFLYSLFKVFLSYSSGDQELINENLIYCIKTTAYFVVWTLYLYRSERVKYTFSVEQPSD